MNTYYLSSLDSVKFGITRKCTVIKASRLTSGKDCLIVNVDPPVSLQDRNVPDDLDTLILVSRHEGQDLVAPNEFPVFVFIARSLTGNTDDEVSKADLEILAWGEIYRTKDDADNHHFDKKR